MKRRDQIKKILSQKEDIIKLKKYNVKHAQNVTLTPLRNVLNAEKGVIPSDSDEVIYRKIIANTYNWMDSHGDVHMNGIFKKSISEVTPFFLHDHKFETTAKLGEVLKAYEEQILWSELGVEKSGYTQSLILDVSVEKFRNEAIFNDYKANKINQHSVGMQYVKIDLAVDDADDKEGFALYNKTIPFIGNQEEAEKNGYYFVVSEAKLRETSAVLMGSNSLTGIYDNNSTPEDQIKEIFEKIGDIEKINNICNNIKETYNAKPLKDTLKSKPSYFEIISKI